MTIEKSHHYYDWFHDSNIRQMPPGDTDVSYTLENICMILSHELQMRPKIVMFE